MMAAAIRNNKSVSFSIPICLSGILVSSTVAALPSFSEVNVGIGSITEIDGKGIAWIDIDNDGDQDLFIPKSVDPGSVTTIQSKLYRNNLIPDGVANFTDISGNLPASLASFYSTGAAIGDYDGDGWDDIFVTNVTGGVVSDGSNRLLRNNQNSTFSDKTQNANLHNESKRSESAVWGDVNGDGWLDLYVANNSVGSGCAIGIDNENERNDLYLNNGNNTFTRRNDLGAADFGCAWATTMSDFDQDGDLDIFVVNDVFTYLNLEAPPSEIYVNNGVGNFTPLGFGVRIAGMGIAVGDYDNDGDLDYFQTDNAPGSLSTQIFGGFDTQRIGDGVMHWGTAFLDADNDGDLDLYGVPAEYLENDGNGGWSGNLAGPAGLVSLQICGSINDSCGMAVADYNNDGYMDIVIHESDGDIDLFSNDRVPANNWLKVDLKGNNPNHRGIGSRVTAILSNGKKLVREVRAGSSLGSTNAFPVHFGLPVGTSVNVITVAWLSGQVDHLVGSSLNQMIPVAEGGVNTAIDTDGDGLSNIFEICYDGDCSTYKPFPSGGDLVPNNPDTDGDGMNDGDEVSAGRNPLVNEAAIISIITSLLLDCSGDSDADGLDDCFEQQIGTNPNLFDSDGDGLSDYQEVNFDGDPVNYNPYNPGTNPTGTDLDANATDTDDDGFSDQVEVSSGSDPLNAADTPAADGDLNNDGVVNAADVLIAARIISGQLTITAEKMTRGDVAPLVNGQPAPDGQFNVGDLVVIQRKALGLIGF